MKINPTRSFAAAASLLVVSLVAVRSGQACASGMPGQGQIWLDPSWTIEELLKGGGGAAPPAGPGASVGGGPVADGELLRMAIQIATQLPESEIDAQNRRYQVLKEVARQIPLAKLDRKEKAELLAEAVSAAQTMTWPDFEADTLERLVRAMRESGLDADQASDAVQAAVAEIRAAKSPVAPSTRRDNAFREEQAKSLAVIAAEMSVMRFSRADVRNVFKTARALEDEISYGDTDWDSARWSKARALSEIGLRMAYARQHWIDVTKTFVEARERALQISNAAWRDEALAEIAKTMVEAGAAGQ